MERKTAETAAVQHAVNNFRNVAVIYTVDGHNWNAGSHNESRYLDSYFPDNTTEIWYAVINRYPVTPPEETDWICYKSPGNAPDYVAMTGATGELADLMVLIRNLQNEWTRPTSEDN